MGRRATGETDTRPWMWRYARNSWWLVALGVVATVLGGVVVVHDLRQSSTITTTTTFQVPDPTCSEQPIDAPVVASPATCTRAEAITETKPRQREQVPVIVFAFGLVAVILGGIALVRVRRWRRITAATPWSQGHIDASLVRQRQPLLTMVRVDKSQPGRLMIVLGASRARQARIDRGPVQLVPDGAGKWLARVEYDKYPFILREAGSPQELKRWQAVDFWSHIGGGAGTTAPTVTGSTDPADWPV